MVAQTSEQRFKTVEFSIDRHQFGSAVADALLASAQIDMPMFIFYDLADSGFDYANTLHVSTQLLPVFEVNAKKSDVPLPLNDPKMLEAVLEAASEEASETIFEEMLPDLLEQLIPHMESSRAKDSSRS